MKIENIADIQDITDKLIQNAANIGMMAATLQEQDKIDVPSMVDLSADIIYKAREFEELYNPDEDYIESIDKFAEDWLLEEYGI